MSFLLSIPSFCHIVPTDSTSVIHRIGIEYQPTLIFRSNPFLKGNNYEQKKANFAHAFHLKYSFAFRPYTISGQLYKNGYQGIGVSYSRFGFPKELGNPVSIYFFHGASIAMLNHRISWNYEWNFGISLGWKPYDTFSNDYNQMIGSKANAYLNLSTYLNWRLSPMFDLQTGVSFSHFSNGNTKYPNAGLNTSALKLGLVYNIQRSKKDEWRQKQAIPFFEKHTSYDVIVFGSWRRRGMHVDDEHVAAPNAYGVAGFNFAPMYNFDYRFRAGISFDGVYDASANLYYDDYIVGTMPEFKRPVFSKQIALGVSGRAEYVMPYFAINVGMGVNVLHHGGDMRGIYQVLALKVDVTRNLFLHIGYNLKDFKDPNYLMLGFGIRLHNLRRNLF
ncbi:MAG: acyloxyacyl hydrolase [Phocaeicola sp.]|uniref:acyloxyacyl hydrolase n=1 Tax=Phocaeicola TaxID=909656 RepID=UPI00234F7D1F|nr:acyloxyacyl hydrolase [Phocaeicola oris]MCE2616908.1 acyloxyacyl hydrolase [Phocaeicola oris]